MLNLNRTQVGQFNISNSITMEELENKIEETQTEGKDKELIRKQNEIAKNIIKNLITIEELFKEKENIELNDRKLELFLNGVKLTQNKPDGIYKIYNNKNFIGIGIIKDNLLKRDIVI